MASASVPASIPINDLEKGRRSAKALKGHFTRKLTALRTALQNLATSPSAFATAQVENLFAQAEDAYNKAEEAYNAVFVLDEVSNQNDWDAKITVIFDELCTARTAVAVALKSAKRAPPPPTTPPPASQQSGRLINDTLRPSVLSLENNPIELRQWIDKLKTYFSTNQFSRETTEVQQAYVKQVIDSDLEVRVSLKIDSTTQIFGGDGMVSFVEDEFRQRYPLFTRRLEYFRYRRSDGQKVSSFVAKLIQLSHEADLPSLQVDDIQIFRVITGVHEDRLLTKLLELKEPTFEDVRNKITQWEMTNISKKSVNGPKNANSGKAVDNSNQGGKGGKNNGGKSSTMVTPESLKGRCSVLSLGGSSVAPVFSIATLTRYADAFARGIDARDQTG